MLIKLLEVEEIQVFLLGEDLILLLSPCIEYVDGLTFINLNVSLCLDVCSNAGDLGRVCHQSEGGEREKWRMLNHTCSAGMWAVLVIVHT